MTTPDYFICTALIQRHFRQQARYIQAQFLTLAKLWIEKDITKFADGACGQLAIALFNICQIPQCSRYLHQNHGLPLGRALELQ